MTLIMRPGGITVKLKIYGYRPSPSGDWTADWCKTDFSFSSGSWLNYCQTNDEVFLARELEELYDKLGCLLTGRLERSEGLEMMEPDFAFALNPKRDLRKDPGVIYAGQGCETEDISMDWVVRFWHDGLTSNYLSVRLRRNDIEHFHAYLGLVTGKKAEISRRRGKW